MDDLTRVGLYYNFKCNDLMKERELMWNTNLLLA
jgi:hypothetical protein